MSPLFPIEQLLRLQRNRDWLEAVAGWQSSHGAERSYWRGRVRAEIKRERAHLADSYDQMIRAAQLRKLAA